MASKVLSSESYINYLNDYIHIILNDTDGYLLEHLNRSYFDEIQSHARSVLAQWFSEQTVDEELSSYIKNVANLNHKVASLTHKHHLNKQQQERIDDLLFHSETVQIITSIIRIIIDTNARHQDDFLRHLCRFIDAFALMKNSHTVFGQITKQALASKYYKEYLTGLFTLDIQPIHLFFVGTIGQLASPMEDSPYYDLYSKYLTTFYHEKELSNDIDLHRCTLGIISQLNVSFLMNNSSCISALKSILINASSKSAIEYSKNFLLPILKLFNLLCTQSKTIACFINTNQLIDILLPNVTNKNDYQININACLLLGHIISENQLNRLRISYKLTMKLIDLLKYHKQNTDEILSSLLSVTIHEQIQLTIANTYQLKTFIELVDSYPMMYDIIWKLSFNSEILQQLIVRHDDFLKKLSSLPTIAAAYGILQNVKMKNLPRLPVTNDVSNHISLISSSKDYRIVEKIEENLKKRNFYLGTITNSSCILFCISEESKHDCACHAAVLQALQDCRKIIPCIVQTPYRFDDWFSILKYDKSTTLNTMELDVENFVCEVEKDLHMYSQLPNIVKHTRIITPRHYNCHNIVKKESSRSPTPPLQLEQQQLVQYSLSPHVGAKKIQNWTHHEVLEWCGKHNLSAFSKILTLYDGRSLLALAHVSRMSAPHTIINQLRNDCRKHGLRLSFVELVRFQAALDELLRLERSVAKRQSISALATRYVYKRRGNK